MRRRCGHREYPTFDFPRGLDAESAARRRDLRRWVKALALRPCAACRHAALGPIEFEIEGRRGAVDPRDEWRWEVPGRPDLAAFLWQLSRGTSFYAPSPDSIPHAKLQAMVMSLEGSLRVIAWNGWDRLADPARPEAEAAGRIY